MSSLLEKLAAKRAAALATQEPVPASVPPQVEAVPVTEPVPEGKPLSFAEKMALKKASASQPVVEAADPVTAEAEKSIATISPIKERIVAAVEAEEAVDTSSLSEADAQAYVDIKAKINMLADMSQDDLKGAMTELKKALLQNPQACYLILPQDIGQMVIALRTMKNEAVVAAEKAPKGTKPKASKALTADEIAAAFDSL